MSKKATIHRIVTPKHLCPWGLKAIDHLKRAGFEIDDVHLRSKEESERFKEEHNVSETPQVFIDGELIGGYDDMLRYLGKPVEDEEAVTYKPIIAIFSVTLLMAVSVSYGIKGALFSVAVVELFVAFSMCVLGILKLKDLEAFSTQFLNYDLLAKKVVRYAYIYPFVETGAGLLMIGGIAPLLSSIAALFIGTVGAFSVFKAVYLEKRELKCACIGGNSNVPLGFISLTENLMMMAIAVWMLVKVF